MSKLIALSKGKVAIVDDEDFALLSSYKWYATSKKRVGFPDVWYAIRTEYDAVSGKSKTIYMHRQICMSPEAMDVDHRDCNGLNNQRKNLRPASRSQNIQSARIITRGLPCGVYATPQGRFRAIITSKNRRIHLGNFMTIEDASAAYEIAAKELHGDFSKSINKNNQIVEA